MSGCRVRELPVPAANALWSYLAQMRPWTQRENLGYVRGAIPVPWDPVRHSRNTRTFHGAIRVFGAESNESKLESANTKAHTQHPKCLALLSVRKPTANEHNPALPSSSTLKPREHCVFLSLDNARIRSSGILLLFPGCCRFQV